MLLFELNHSGLYCCRQYASVLYYLLSDKASHEGKEAVRQTASCSD